MPTRINYGPQSTVAVAHNVIMPNHTNPGMLIIQVWTAIVR